MKVETLPKEEGEKDRETDEGSCCGVQGCTLEGVWSTKTRCRRC